MESPLADNRPTQASRRSDRGIQGGGPASPKRADSGFWEYLGVRRQAQPLGAIERPHGRPLRAKWQPFRLPYFLPDACGATARSPPVSGPSWSPCIDPQGTRTARAESKRRRGSSAERCLSRVQAASWHKLASLSLRWRNVSAVLAVTSFRLERLRGGSFAKFPGPTTDLRCCTRSAYARSPA